MDLKAPEKWLVRPSPGLIATPGDIVVPVDVFLHISSHLTFTNFQSFVLAFWPDGDEEELIQTRLWAMSCHKFEATFYNGKCLEIEYNFDVRREGRDRVLIKKDCLLPIFGGVSPTGLAEFNKYNNGPGLPTNAEMKLNKEVTQIKWSEDPIADVRVMCKDGSEYKAKNVIVTVSLGVLKVSHASIFSPSLPKKKIESINNIPMGLLGKVILSFDKIWLPKDIQVFDFFWTTEDKAQIPEEDAWTMQLVGATHSLGSDNVLVLWTFGEMGRYIETLPDDLVKDKAASVLRRFMGNDVPEPSAMYYQNGVVQESTYSGQLLV